MSSLKHLTLPRRKNRNKDKHNNSMDSQASSISQLNSSLQSPPTNTVSHSISSGMIHIKFISVLFFTLIIESFCSALPEPYTGGMLCMLIAFLEHG